MTTDKLPNYPKEYLKAIQKGKEIVSNKVRAVYEREVAWMKKPPAGFPYFFDEKEGLRHIEFIERFCKHSKGRFAGKPVQLELFQKAKIQLVFGWRHKDTKLRRFREVVDIRGRKCGKSTETENKTEKSEGVMTYAEYAAAELEAPVVVETYVQAHQSWWDGKVTVYTQDQDGAYFIYNMTCSEEDAAKLVPGQKIKVTGFKGEWSGEIEIVDATFEFVDGDTFTAQPTDVTELLGKDELIDQQNKLV